MPPVVAIDFDKTLTLSPEDAYKIGGEEPNPEMIEYVRYLKEEKHFGIILWTARPWSHAGHIAGLATMWGVPFNGIRCEKGGAEVYLDDKAVNPADDGWQDRVEEMAIVNDG